MSLNYDIRKNNPEATATAQRIVDWMMKQKFQGQDILHAAVCCDFVGHSRFVNAIAEIIAGREPTTEHKHG